MSNKENTNNTGNTSIYILTQVDDAGVRLPLTAALTASALEAAAKKIVAKYLNHNFKVEVVETLADESQMETPFPDPQVYKAYYLEPKKPTTIDYKMLVLELRKVEAEPAE